MKSIFGQKLGMTRVFTEAGDSVGVTVVKVDPATVVRTKTVEKDGYNAVVLGFGEIREKLLSKPVKGQFAKREMEPRRNLREIRVDTDEIPEAGEVFGVDKLVAVVLEHGPGSTKDLRNIILDRVKTFSQGCEQRDDITLMIVQV